MSACHQERSAEPLDNRRVKESYTSQGNPSPRQKQSPEKQASKNVGPSIPGISVGVGSGIKSLFALFFNFVWTQGGRLKIAPQAGMWEEGTGLSPTEGNMICKVTY